jgi:MFS family permease
MPIYSTTTRCVRIGNSKRILCGTVDQGVDNARGTRFVVVDRVKILWLGVAIGLYCLGQVTSSFVLGRVALRVPLTLCVLMSLLFDIAGSALYAFSSNIYMLLGARFLAGVGAGNVAVARAYVSSVFPKAARPTAMSYLATAQATGFVYGPGT